MHDAVYAGTFRITVFAVAMNREKNFPDSGSSLSSSMNNNLTQGE